MGEAALQGRDKLTFVVDEPDRELRALGRAADRGVHGQGGQGHPARGRRAGGPPGSYGDDRVFAYLKNADEPDEDTEAKMEELRKAGQPVITLSVRGAGRPRSHVLLR